MRRIDPRNALPGRIDTARLVLRAPMRGDVPALVRLADNPNVARNLSRLPSPYTGRHALDFIERIALREDERAYAVTLRDETLIGIAGYHFERGLPPELGYWLGEPFWGRGYATEAARALVEAGQRTGQFPRIAASALARNALSLRVLEKAGFKMLETAGSHARHPGQPVSLLELEQPRWI
jgi:RimJ/RimL family protein N-acetyltransferase